MGSDLRWKEIIMKKTEMNVETLRTLFEEHPAVSLRTVAKELEVSYNAVLKASKAPIPGEAYDPDATNYDAIFVTLSKRDKLDQVLQLDWDTMEAKAHTTRGTLVKDIAQFPVGSLVYLRENNSTPFEVIYKTETSIVIMLQGTSEPRVLKNSTFLFKGPSFTPRTVVAEDAAE